jgi:quercetin dioxygenase-like cupin family protein
VAAVPKPTLAPITDDPDDWRPDSRWALVTDPGDEAGRVDSFTFLVEEIAPGDRIPLHRHKIDELLVYLEGRGAVRLGDRRYLVEAGSSVFVPAGAAHGTENVGDTPLHIHAIFASPVIEIEMLERNPQPGTEGEAPKTWEYDARTGEARVIG